MRFRTLACAFSCALLSRPAAARPAEPPYLFPQIALSDTRIAFVQAGDLWLVPRRGGVATRVTHGPEDDSSPSFSPDGSRLAFSRAVGGAADVYVVPVEGGTPTRLTFHPAAEVVRDWSPDGREILFTAARGPAWRSRLYTVPAAGGPTRELSIPLAWNGVFTSDGRIVYNLRETVGRYAPSWRGYRGGAMAALELADLRTGTFTALSTDAANDRLPVRAGDRVFFASDRAGGLYDVHVLDLASGRANPLTHFRGTGIGALAGAPDGTVAFERDGALWLLDAATGRIDLVPITIPAEDVAERHVSAADHVDVVHVGPGGEVAVGARGDIFLIDVSGKARNLTASSGVAEQSPAFSADGRQLAWISFGAEGDALVLERLRPAPTRRVIRLPRGRGGYIEPRWSPDGRHLTVTDLRGGLWLVDVAAGAAHAIDQATHMSDASFSVDWSPDGQWLVYERHLPNNNRGLFLRRVTGGPAYPITSGEIDAGNPVFDRTGRRIFFVSSGNAAASEAFGMYPAILEPLIQRRIQTGEIDLSQGPDALRRSLDPAAFARRVRTLPFAPRDYSSIVALTDSTLLASARQWPATPGRGDPTVALFRLDAHAPETAAIASGVEQFAVSPDRGKLLVHAGEAWTVRTLPADTGGRTLDLSAVALTIHPREEWRQIHREAWRAMRDLFYDPAHHGQDVEALEARYARYLPGITRRADLTALLYRGLGNVSVSHIAFDGGDEGVRPATPPASGLLGADFAIDGDRFRFTRIFPGDPFALEANPAAPLDEVDPPVRPGDFLLRIDGVDVTAGRDLQSYLLGTAGRATRLTVARSRDGRDARTVTVHPLASDAALREAAWIAANRARVQERSNGTVAYVYLPDFQERGWAAGLRQWTAATDRDGVVIDQRYNPGGWGGDLMLDLVSHRPLAYYAFRDARDLPFPVISNTGPRALIVNERNGSSADVFPWLFQRARVGPVVGHRTAGWGVGHLYRYVFTDGGGLDLPLRAFFDPAGQWGIENHGVTPDLGVDTDPAAALRGEDAQLDAAIDAVLAARKAHPAQRPQHPAPMRFPPQRGR